MTLKPILKHPCITASKDDKSIELTSTWLISCQLAYDTAARHRMSEDLNKCCRTFFTEALIFHTTQQPPIKCIPHIRPYSQLDHALSILHHSSPNFYRWSKSVKYGLDFDTTLLWAALILKRSNTSVPKYPIWCSDDGTLFSPNVVQFGQPPLKSRVWKYVLLERNC